MHQHAAQLREDDRGPARSVSPLVAQFAHRRLTWWPQLGIGHYPVECGIAPYDQDYFDAFDRNAHTDLGRALMRARADFVDEHFHGPLIDVGIGSGAFVDLRRERGQTTYGYDVNPAGIEWLGQRMAFIDPYVVQCRAMTLWDVLEHIPDFPALLANVREWVFLSLPIFRDADHVLRSKHFKPDEHCWYMSQPGLVLVMGMCGFDLMAENTMETALGREDIGTFAFRRQV